MRNYKPETLYEYYLEIRVYEIYLKKYEKEMKILKSKDTNWNDRHLLWQHTHSIKTKLPVLYKNYLGLLKESNKPKLTLIYQSKLNNHENRKTVRGI